MNRENEIKAFVRLLDIMDELRTGCPWDSEQTIESLRPLTIEETYELSDAILNNDYKNIEKELGDLMLHLVFYSKIASEQGLFNISDVLEKLSNKLEYRHPHIFGTQVNLTSGEVIKNWEQLKRRERDGNKTVLSGVPKSLPSLVKAYRVQDKVRAVGFDWDRREDVWDKVREEIAEFEEELKREEMVEGERAENDRVQAEFGDLLFSMVNVARLYGINPDTALEMTNNKFIKRFGYLEQWAKDNEIDINKMTLTQMDRVWEESKKME